MKDLKKRVITGSGIFVVFVGILLLTFKVHWAFYDVFVLALAVAASIEVYNAICKKMPKPLLPVILCTTIIGYVAYVVAQEVVSIGGITSYFCVLLISCLTLIVCALCSKKINTNNVVSTMFVIVYPASMLMYMLGLNHLPSPYNVNAILMLVAVSTFTDTFAFFVGSVVKGKKLCPKISPNKTISGAIGGLIGGVLAGALLFFLSQTGVGAYLGMGAFTSGISNCINFMCMGFACSVATQFGDLFASYIKRLAGIKDYSNLLPGHGGVMDRIDGMTVGCLVVYLYTSILVVI